MAGWHDPSIAPGAGLVRGCTCGWVVHVLAVIGCIGHRSVLSNCLPCLFLVHTGSYLERMLHMFIMCRFSYYRFSNPTGHYEFNLTTAVHQALVGRLKVRGQAEKLAQFLS